MAFDEPLRAAPQRYLNRELSWLRFNERVLEEARNGQNPLLERLKFLAIFESNLDEFYMVRVSGLIEQVEGGVLEPSPDGLGPEEQLLRIAAAVTPLRRLAADLWTHELRPRLAEVGIRLVESVILGFIMVIAGCFLLEIVLARPAWGEVARGLVPRLDSSSLYVAVAMLGATVMPHNLYLHSSLVQTRSFAADTASKRAACRFNLLDSVIALNGALLVNAAILILAASTFYRNGLVVTQIEQAHAMLAPLLGTTLASIAFALALLFSGQSSTITGTMAGQIVMEGFLNFRMRPWLRRLITRCAAVLPAALTIQYAGNEGAYRLLILSQVVLSLQLPFAIVPLIRFTGDRRRMGELVNPRWVQALGAGCAVMIVLLNLWLAWTELGALPRWAAAALIAPLLGLLGYVSLARPQDGAAAVMPEAREIQFAEPAYRKILVPVDHSALDRVALAHAVAMGKPHGAVIHLLHVEEGVASQVYGEEAKTAEVELGRQYFEDLAEAVRRTGLKAELVILHGKETKRLIIQHARGLKPDLIVMGAHGHRGVMDLVFGATINEVRHGVDVPVLVVRAQE